MPAVIFAQTQPEKVAHRGFHAGGRFIVPIDAHDDALEMIRLAGGDGEPDMGDGAGPVRVQHRQGGAGCDGTGIGVGAGGIAAGGAMGNIGLLPGEVRLPGKFLGTGRRDQPHGQNQKRRKPHHVPLP